MPPSYFPLRWESTRDQWWYASPIDWAAANGHYDLVSELLHLDTNLLIKLTSLRRIRRLETVWDDEAQFDDVAKCRCHVAKKLLLDCQTKEGHNSLVRAGYGGWLLYTAASAGDVGFIKELLDRDPLLVFGEGEYGVTDLLYAAARSKNSEVFRLLLDLAFLGRASNKNRELDGELDGLPQVFRWEMMNRAIHAAARGGNLAMLRELLGDCSDISGYRDGQGSTILHTASGRGQVEVVKDLVPSFDISAATDNQGNTAIHVASYRGYLAVVEILVRASPSSASSMNNDGDTILHMALAGFRTPGFRRLDRQIELMEQLLNGKVMDLQAIINVRNNDGRTSLHMAVVENVQYNLVELLMAVPSIDLNIRDAEGMTPLDLLKQLPTSASSEILVKQLISAGGVSSSHDFRETSALVFQSKLQGIGSSPGTTFRIPDAEIYLFMDKDDQASDVSFDPAGEDLTLRSGELSQFDSGNWLDDKKSGTSNYAARRLKNLLWWPKGKTRKAADTYLEDAESFDLHNACRDLERSPIPLRERYSTSMSFPNSKKALSFNSLPSPSTKRKFTTGLMHGVIRAMPHLAVASQSPSSLLSESSMSSPASATKLKDIKSEGPFCAKSPQRLNKGSSFSKKVMNQYFCFGIQGLSVQNSISYTQPNQRYKNSRSLVA